MNDSIRETVISGKKSIPELLTGMPDKDFSRLTVEGFSGCAEIQSLVLKQILECSRNTEYGQKHKFKDIHSTGDFQDNIPVTDWNDVAPYSDRMAEGETDLLFPGRPKTFILTSGTSGNNNKLVPESETGSLARQLVSRFRRVQLIRNFPAFDRTGYVLPLSYVTSLPPTKAGIPIGYASGIALNNSMGERQMIRMAFPMEVLLNSDAESSDYLLLRFALQQRNVIMVVGNNAGRFNHLAARASSCAAQIIRDIEQGTIHNSQKIDKAVLEKITPLLVADPERAAELRLILKNTGGLLPKDYWPSLMLMTFWLSATVGHYIKDIKPLVSEKTSFFDAGYGSSEVRINIPFSPGNPAGILSVYTAFYEFIPEKGGTPLLAHQLKDGGTYEMLVTTWGGLYRYNMKDMVRVEGFTNDVPNIVFQYKSSDILNIAHEKIPASLVNELIRKAAISEGADTVQIQIYPDHEKRHYCCYLETTPETKGFNAESIADKVHQHLMAINNLYYRESIQEKMMNPLQISEMKQGWQNHLYEIKIREGMSSTQVKLPVMIRQKADNNWIK